jgi:uncharacterized protein (TIGR02266 family)
VELDVDYRIEGTYLFASIADISSCGIFVRTETPLAQGTLLQLCFEAPPTLANGDGRFELAGEVVWITADTDRPGMGVRFLEVSAADQRRLLELVRAIAYVDDSDAN